MNPGLDRPVLVAGGAGFLGSHVCERLLADGHAVLCVDDFTTGSLHNIEGLRRHSRFRFLQHDVTEPLRADVKAVFNLACPASPVHYQADPIRTTLTSVKGTHHLLQLADWAGAPMLQASTSEVYGDPTVHPQPESYWGHVNPTGIRSCYDEGKRCAESLCFDYRRRHDVDVRVVRIFNTYGPRMQVNDGRVVSNFIVQALRDDPITIYGDGLQSRSFCYVDDLVEAFMRVIAAPANLPSPLNLGNPGEFTMLELAEKVVRLTGSRSQLVFEPLPSDDPTQRRPSIERAMEHLGWKPTVELDEGLTRTIEYFDTVLSGDRVAVHHSLADSLPRLSPAVAHVGNRNAPNGNAPNRNAPNGNNHNGDLRNAH